MPAFPAYPKLVFRGELVEDPSDSAVRRTQMEDGMVQQTQTASKALVRRPLQYLLVTKADKNAFVDFVETTLHRGADWFDWTDPHDAQVKLARIVNGKVRYTALRKDLERWRAELDLETYR